MKTANSLMILGAALLLGLFYYPLWNINLIAPQYPEGLSMNIHINDIKGGREFDIMNINGLNHYIGMETIPEPEDMKEFTIFPIVIASMAAIGMLLGIIGFIGGIDPKWFLIWLGTMCVLGILGMYDFYAWLVSYGTNLDPNASIKLLDPSGNPMQYNPPLIGHKKLLNFDVDSWPHIGAYFMAAGMALVFVAYIFGVKSFKKSK